METSLATTATKIAVFGTATEPRYRTWYGWPEPVRALASDLGEMIGTAFESKVELLTGGSIGIPNIIAAAARRRGTSITAYSGEQTIEEHQRNPNYASPEHFDQLKFIEGENRILKGLTQRSLRMIDDADALIFMGGRTGTLAEYCAAYDDSNKPMYVLLGAGGSVDKILRLKINKERFPKVYSTGSVYSLVTRLDRDFMIADFQHDPEITIIDERTGPIHGSGWPQFLTPIDPLSRIIFRRD